MRNSRLVVIAVAFLSAVSVCAILTTDGDSDAASGLNLHAGQEVDRPKVMELGVFQTEVQCFDFPVSMCTSPPKALTAGSVSPVPRQFPAPIR